MTNSQLLVTNACHQKNINQWPRQLWGTGARAPLTSNNNFIFSSLLNKSDCQLFKNCAVCQSSLRRCQQLTALSISIAFVTKLLGLVIKPTLL